MHVRFYEQRPDGPEEVGALVLRDGRLVAEPPDSISLNNVLAEPVRVDQGSKPPLWFDPVRQPQEFLRALPTAYHGTYFWAGKVED